VVQTQDDEHSERSQPSPDDLFWTWAQTALIGVFIVQDGVFAWVNRQFERDTGYSADELVGHRPYELVHADDWPRVREQAVAMLKGQRDQPYEYRCVARNGQTRTIMEAVTSVPYRGRPAALGNFMDITARRREEAALQQSEALRRESEAAARASMESAHLLRAQLEILSQQSVPGVLAAVVEFGQRLEAGALVGSLMWDPGVNAWYLTSLLDASARPLDVQSLGLSAGPFPFRIPETAAPRPLAHLLGQAWGQEACAALEQRLGTSLALCMPLQSASGPRGALIALLREERHAPAVAGVLAHAATAAARALAVEANQEPQGVLDPRTLAERGSLEVQRAERYSRPLAVAMFVVDRLSLLTAVGNRLARTLRAWDFVGRWEMQRPALLAVLPETDRQGGLGLVDRMKRELADVHVGVAAFPQDGSSLAQLASAAAGRAARVSISMEGLSSPDSVGATVWIRGAPAGTDADTVRCPICLTPYGRPPDPGAPPERREQARATARAVLQAQCPRHAERFTVGA
jgi:PAS domain S-box-containing protein